MKHYNPGNIFYKLRFLPIREAMISEMSRDYKMFFRIHQFINILLYLSIYFFIYVYNCFSVIKSFINFSEDPKDNHYSQVIQCETQGSSAWSVTTKSPYHTHIN